VKLENIRGKVGTKANRDVVDKIAYYVK